MILSTRNPDALHLAVIDWEKGKGWDFYHQAPGCDAALIEGVDRDGLLQELARHPDIALVAVETAHFVPRTPRSLAQVFTQDELETLYAASPVPFVLVDARQGVRARKTGDDSQLGKLRGLMKVLRQQVATGNLRQFHPRTDEDIDRFGIYRAHRRAAQAILNPMRASADAYTGPFVDRVLATLAAHFDEIPVEHASALGLKRMTRGPRKGQVVFASAGTLVMTTATIAIGVGPRMSWTDAKSVYALHPYGGTGLVNLVRANLTHEYPAQKKSATAASRKAKWAAVRFLFRFLQAHDDGAPVAEARLAEYA